jgi:hypothetical protein
MKQKSNDEKQDEGIEHSHPSDDKKSFRRKYIEPLDYSPPSTATNPENAAQDISTPMKTGRHAYTENATFATEDIPSTWSNSHRQSLNELNRNFYADEGSHIETEKRKQDEINDTMAWGKRIGLTNVEAQRAAHLATLPTADDKRRLGVDATILSALTIAANEPVVRRRLLRSTVPDLDGINTALIDDYEQLREELNIETQTVRQAREKIRQIM